MVSQLSARVTNYFLPPFYMKRMALVPGMPLPSLSRLMAPTLDRCYVIRGGQTLLGGYKAPAPANSIAAATLSFSSGDRGTLFVKPADGSANRTITIERFPISTPAFSTSNGGFESGWWWNEAEGGRGYFVEVQGSNAFIGSFMYDASGQPVWYVSSATLDQGLSLNGPLLQYANGQSLTGNYKPAAPTSTNPGNMTFNFIDGSHGTIVLPNGNTVPVKRFIFNPTQTTVQASIRNCYKINTNVVNYHLGSVTLSGTAFPSHRVEVSPLSGFGPTGSYRTKLYYGETAFAAETDQELMLNGLKPIRFTDGYTLVTTIDGFMSFNLTPSVEEKYTLQQHAQSVITNSAGDITQVKSVTLLEIGPLQTYGKYFPLTCKVKERVVSMSNNPKTGDGYQILWYAPGYDAVRFDTYSGSSGLIVSKEVVSVETEPN